MLLELASVSRRILSDKLVAIFPLLFYPEQYRDIILACFSYISLLRASSWPEWYQDELRSIADLDFRFADKRQSHAYARTLSNYLTLPIPRSEVLTAPRLIYDWDEAVVREAITRLTIDQCRIFLMAEDFSGVIDEDRAWEREPWYRTEYQEQRIDEDLADKVSPSSTYSTRHQIDFRL